MANGTLELLDAWNKHEAAGLCSRGVLYRPSGGTEHEVFGYCDLRAEAGAKTCKFHAAGQGYAHPVPGQESATRPWYAPRKVVAPEAPPAGVDAAKLRVCGKCGVTSASKTLRLWKMPDPYYGYGHWARLRCDECPANAEDPFFEKFTYNAYLDDFHLGLTRTVPEGWRYETGAKTPVPCSECKSSVAPDALCGSSSHEADATVRCAPCHQASLDQRALEKTRHTVPS